MTQENLDQKQNSFYRAGYCLGQAKDETKYKETLASLAQELTRAETLGTTVVQQAKDAALKILGDFKNTAADLQKQAKEFVQYHLQFIELLETESRTWAAMGSLQPNFYEKRSNEGFEIFEKCKTKIRETGQSLDEQVQAVHLDNKVEQLESKLRQYFEEEVKTARANYNDFRNGYAQGSGIRQSVDNLGKKIKNSDDKK